MNGLARWVTSRLWSSPRRDLQSTIAFQIRAYVRATWLVRAFYAASVMWVLVQTNGWAVFVRVEAVHPQWPAQWLSSVDLQMGIRFILIGHLVTALWAMMLPQWRSARLAFFVMLLQYMAFTNGFGKVGHDIHAWLWVSGVLVLLPSGGWYRPKRIAERHYFLTILWSCQVIVLFFYTLTGLWKVCYAIYDLWNPDLMSTLQIDGFSYIVANRILKFDQDTLLGEFLVRNPAVGWVLYNVTMYLEATSLIIAFRPRLHRLWGLGLIAFHFGTQLAMGFTFQHNVLLVGLLFVCSPWAPEEISVREALLDLPGVHFVSHRAGRLRRPPPEVAAD